MDLHKKLVNSVGSFDKTKLLILIAVESKKTGTNKVALSHIAFLAAAIAGQRQKLQTTCNNLTNLIYALLKSQAYYLADFFLIIHSILNNPH